MRPAGEHTSRIFLDRGRELAELRSAFEDALGGHGRLLLLTGEPGIGKSRLADELAEYAAGRGAMVLWGRCWEEHGASAYWPWLQVARACLQRSDAAAITSEVGRDLVPLVQGLPGLAELIPGGGPRSAETPTDRFPFFDAFASLLRAAAARGPLVLLLDDLQWADAASLLLLRFLAADVHQSPILVVGTHREPEGASASIAKLLTEVARLGRSIALSGLGESDVGRFVQHVAGISPPPKVVGDLHAVTGGNPFFLDELVQLLRGQGRIHDRAELGSGGLEIPARVRQVIRLRLAPLSLPCREILETAAVVGREFSLPILEEAAAATTAEILQAIGEALPIGVVRPASGGLRRYGFAHALIRETLYDEIPYARRAGLHHRIAEALERHPGVDPEAGSAELAHHFFCALAGGSIDKAIHYSLLAARSSMAHLAYETAIAHFDRALGALTLQGSADDRRRLDALLGKADAERMAGRGESARESFAAAIDLARRAGRAEDLARAVLGVGALCGAMVEAYDPSGRVDETLVALLEEALSRLDSDDRPPRARLLGRLAAALYWAPGSGPRRDSLSRDAVAMAERIGDPAVLAATLNTRRYALWGPDRLDERLADATRMLDLARAAGDHERVLQAHQWRLWDLMERGDVPAADHEIEEHRRLAEALRQPFYLGYSVMFRAMRALMSGSFAGGEALAQEALAIGQRAENPVAPTLFGAQAFWAYWAQGKLPLLAGAMTEIVADVGIPAARCAVPFVYAELGRMEEARAELERLAAHDFADLPRDLGWLLAVTVLSLTAATLGDPAKAEILHRMLEPYAARNLVIGPPPASCFGPVSYVLGRLAAALGRSEEASERFATALAMSEAMGAPPFAAQALHAWGALRLESGDPRGGEMADRALAIAEQLGMAGLRQQIELLRRPERKASRLEPIVSGSVSQPAEAEAVFRRDGEHWLIAWEGKSIRLKNVRGLEHIAELLRRPGEEITVFELDTHGDRPDRKPSRAGPAPGRAGEPASERTRKTVTNRIRRAIERIREEHSALGSHLRRGIRMGAACCYRPSSPARWEA